MPPVPDDPASSTRPRSVASHIASRGGIYRMTVLGAAVGLLALFEAVQRIRVDGSDALPLVVVAVGLGLTTGFSRHKPALAIAGLWLVGGLQALTNTDGILADAAIMIVLFAVSRHGSVTTVWVSGLSIPAAYVAVALYVRAHGTDLSVVLGASALARTTPRPTVALAVAVLLALTLPWLLGLTLRARAQARSSLREMLRSEAMRAVADMRRTEAEELARIKDEQARLARDLHDVVGHSLTVILAQAQSGVYIPDDDAGRLKEIMGTIASTARRSLGDMRGVLTDTPEPGTPALDSLIAPLQEAGRKVEQTITGQARPLAPDIAVVAYRVMQEMLTNALKHGTPTEPIGVRVDWGPVLRIVVRNAVVGDAESRDGLGLDSIRARLAPVQGTLTTHELDGIFVATVAIPSSGSADDGGSEHP